MFLIIVCVYRKSTLFISNQFICPATEAHNEVYEYFFDTYCNLLALHLYLCVYYVYSTTIYLYYRDPMSFGYYSYYLLRIGKYVVVCDVGYQHSDDGDTARIRHYSLVDGNHYYNSVLHSSVKIGRPKINNNYYCYGL